MLTHPATTDAGLLRCLDCGGAIEAPACPGCGRGYPESGGIVEAIGPLGGTNRIAADFYEGPGWARFRPWERAFLIAQGGTRRARMQVLRHLPTLKTARVLEVGIGDGANLPYLPASWEVHGVDIARMQLEGCARRAPAMAGRLARAEAEALPYDDDTFDACWSVGGFNYFRDRTAALLEMRRVTRPGGRLIVADEVPGLFRFGIGHLLGRPGIDAAWLGMLGLPREFVAMVFRHDPDVDADVRRAAPGATRHRIWNRLGYCYVDTTPLAGEPRR